MASVASEQHTGRKGHDTQKSARGAQRCPACSGPALSLVPTTQWPSESQAGRWGGRRGVRFPFASWDWAPQSWLQGRGPWERAGSWGKHPGPSSWAKPDARASLPCWAPGAACRGEEVTPTEAAGA